MQTEDLKILDLITKINKLSKTAISGVNCLNPETCKGKCCNSSQEITFANANALIQRKIALKSDFIRSDTLSFRIRINPQTNYCQFFDLTSNGCQIYQTNLRPPQCCVFPIKFQQSDHYCRMNQAFFITSEKKFHLKKLMTEYLKQSHHEAQNWMQEQNIFIRFSHFAEDLYSFAPRSIEGIRENFDQIKPLTTKNHLYSLIEMCNELKCEISFEACTTICKPLGNMLKKQLPKKLYNYLQKYYPKAEYGLKSLLI